MLWFRSWIEKVLDAIEESGGPAAMLVQFKYGDRLKTLTARECNCVLTRLERLSRRPPPPEDWNDYLGTVAGLLDTLGLPIDLRRLDALLGQVPVQHRARRVSLYRILGRVQTPESLDLLMRHVVSIPQDPAFADIWSILITTERNPKHREVIFPRLAKLLGRTDCAASVMRIANHFKEPPHPLLENAEHVLQWLENGQDENIRSEAAWSLGLMGYASASEALLRATASEGRRLRVEAAQALVRMDDPRGRSVFAPLCEDASVRWRAIEYLKELGRPEFIPKKCLEPEIEAEDDLRQWLEHPNEYGRPPDEVMLHDSSFRIWPGQGQVRCWLFRYRYGDKWDIGMAGPLTFSLFDRKLVDLSIEEIYQAYEAWHQDPERGAPALKSLAEQVVGEQRKKPGQTIV